MQTIDREKLIRTLEAVQPGLSNKDIVEQSSCFVFQNGMVHTFNDEIACSLATDVKITCAVQAVTLLELLKRLPDKAVEISVTEHELKIKGKRRKAGVRMEKDILLPIDKISSPKESAWTTLHDDFCEALSVVRQCTGKDEGAFALTCVHITPKFIESCDSYQITRFKMKTRFKESILIRKEAALHIGSLDITEFAEDETWAHFRNASGLVVSCRRYIEEYPDMKEILQVKGTKTTLPEGLAKTADTAGIFSAEADASNTVGVTLTAGKLILRGEGNNGWYRETKKIKYDGPNMQFLIAPELLKEITKRHRDCEITPDRLKVDGGKFVYVTCLEAVEEGTE